MLNRIRTAMSRTAKPHSDYTQRELDEIGAAHSASHKRLAQIRQLPIEDLDRLYQMTYGTM